MIGGLGLGSSANPPPREEEETFICSPVLLYAPPKYADAIGSHFIPPPLMGAVEKKHLEGSWIDILKLHEKQPAET